MTKTICIYHGIDLDGWTSAAIVLSQFPKAQLIGYNYGQPLPLIELDCDVVMCDVAFPMDIMKKIAQASHSFTWIDHHVSNIRQYQAIPPEELAAYPNWHVKLAKEGELIGACELTWQHFYPDTPMPKAIEMLGMYDCFRHKGTKDELDIMKFQLAAQAIASSPKDAKIFREMSLYKIDLMIKDGAVIYEYLCKQAQETYKHGKDVNIYQKKFIMFNSDRFNPASYGIDYYADGYDGTGCYWFDGKSWHVSLYSMSDEVDCSAICRKFGGGGHKGAAGFEPSWNQLQILLDSAFGGLILEEKYPLP